MLELPAVQDKPQLWSTVLMWLVAELFETLPEVGDRDKPRLVFFLDEAHLLFDGASKAFVDSVSQTVRLIRSKGVGVIFVTHTSKDVPADVLGQLGNRVQHALRAFTPDDEKALRATVRTFPKTDFYDLEELLTQLGTGEAAVTIISESGVPTPVVHTRIRPPRARMGPADDVDGAAKASPLYVKYGTRLDNQSAREMLAERLEQAAEAPDETPAPGRGKKAADATGGGADAHRRLPQVVDRPHHPARARARALRPAEAEDLGLAETWSSHRSSWVSYWSSARLPSASCAAFSSGRARRRQEARSRPRWSSSRSARG